MQSTTPLASGLEASLIRSYPRAEQDGGEFLAARPCSLTCSFLRMHTYTVGEVALALPESPERPPATATGSRDWKKRRSEPGGTALTWRADVKLRLDMPPAIAGLISLFFLFSTLHDDESHHRATAPTMPYQPGQLPLAPPRCSHLTRGRQGKAERCLRITRSDGGGASRIIGKADAQEGGPPLLVARLIRLSFFLRSTSRRIRRHSGGLPRPGRFRLARVPVGPPSKPAPCFAPSGHRIDGGFFAHASALS